MTEDRREITLAFITNGEQVGFNWHESMMELDRSNIKNILYKTAANAYWLPGSRNELVEIWLKSIDTNWILWIDTDMGFRPNTANALLRTANQTGALAVAGLYNGKRTTEKDGLNGYKHTFGPVAYRLADEKSFLGLDSSECRGDRIIPVSAAGFGCVLIHRSLYEAVGSYWHDPLESYRHPGQYHTDDLSFFLRLASVKPEAKIVLDTSVRCNHMKNIWV